MSTQPPVKLSHTHTHTLTHTDICVLMTDHPHCPRHRQIIQNISVQPPRSTRSSSVVTLSRPPTISSLKITDHSFRYASPRLWNQLPDSFRQPRQSCLDSPLHSPVSSSLLSSLLSSSITPSLHAQNLPFQQILPTLDFFYLPDFLHDNGTGPDLSCSSFYF